MINNVTLERTNNIKDLGINFDSQVTFNILISSTVTSAYRTYGFIIRNCNQFSIQVLSTLYFSLVRSKLEYGSIVWNPIYDQYKLAIEKVQKKFIKFLFFKIDGQYPEKGSSYHLMLEIFKFTSLEKRRTQLSVLFLYKLLNNKIFLFGTFIAN